MPHPVTGCRVESLFDSLWLIDAEALEPLVAQALSYDINELARTNREAERIEAEMLEKNPPATPPLPYDLQGGTAIFRIGGFTTKYPTSFERLMGGVSTVRLQRAIRHALGNDQVVNGFLHVDGCPGGSAAGAFDLGDDLAEFNEKKGLWAHIDDQGTSGGMLFATAAKYITANKNAQVGSIGVYSRLVDSSARYEREGIKVIPIIAGKFKGTGTPGVKISEEQIRDAESRAADIHELFTSTVAKRRGISQDAIKKLEARVFIADRGIKYGLVDEISSCDAALQRAKTNKFPEPVKRGPTPVSPTMAASRSRIMLNDQQLKEARSLPGAAHINAENADVVLLQSAASMSTELVELREFKRTHNPAPAKMDSKLAEGHIKLFVREIDHQVSTGTLLPAQAQEFKDAVMPGGKANTDLVSADGTILLPSESISKILSKNKPSGVLEEKTGAQPVVRDNPGEEKDKKETKVTLEALNKTRELHGLAPITDAEFAKLAGPAK